jgi:hypothetical protein
MLDVTIAAQPLLNNALNENTLDDDWDILDELSSSWSC